MSRKKNLANTLLISKNFSFTQLKFIQWNGSIHFSGHTWEK
jgi:hypothetical protein